MRYLKFFKLIGRSWPVIIISFIITILLQWTYSYVPLFISYVIEHLSSGFVAKSNLPQFFIDFFLNANGGLSTVLYVCIGMVGLQLVRYTMLFLESLTRGYVKESTSKKLRVRLYDHIQNLSYKYHNNVDTGDLIQRVTTDVEASTHFVAYGIGQVIYLFSTITFGAFRVFEVNSLMMIITLSAIPIAALSSIFYFKKIDKMNKSMEEAESEMTVVIQENLSGTKVVKAFANECYEMLKLDEKSKKFRDEVVEVNKVAAYYWGFMDVFAYLEYLAIIVIGIISIQNGTMNGASMVTALGVAGMLIWPIRGLGRIINEFSRAMVATDRLYEILEQPSEYENDGSLTPTINGKIEFKNVSFKFDDTDEHLLNGMTFTINRGETVAIVGKTGSGKSTVINLLLRMYDYDSGSILIDGTELSRIKKQYIRSKIGAVLQEPFLYSKTVYENISITNKEAKEDSVFSASRIAAIEKDINTFQQGYQTLVGEKGATLSGGQKQRVAIARVLIANKPILIFDDALSAVDTKTDIAIRNALAKRSEKSTNIIITHRITTAKEADKIVVLNGGKVEAIGTHDELKEKEGLYKVLWQIQGKLEAEFLAMIEGDVNA
ncbi:ABC transporter ATP-binding protein/permease [Acholeplasma sp. OttesenSCG-928-E16]|nr:ABC transporter ATP-binding protein/permease [Acholeplasma sp. OttesenSCG-928-E16]